MLGLRGNELIQQDSQRQRERFCLGCFIPIERLAHDGKALLPFDQPWPCVYSQISFSAEMSHVLSVPLPFRFWGTRRICATACLVPWVRFAWTCLIIVVSGVERKSKQR